jgi:hypothetical protein
MRAALYFPILRGKQGEINAISHLSPLARSGLTPGIADTSEKARISPPWHRRSATIEYVDYRYRVQSTIRLNVDTIGDAK